MKSLPTVYRPMTDNDEPLVLSSWVSSFRDSHYAGPYPFVIYYRAMRDSIDLYRSRPGFRVTVAANAEDPEQIYGWLAHEPAEKPIVYYAYTKDVWRKKGVQRRLFLSAGITSRTPIAYISKTPCLPDILRHTGIIARHNPNLVRKTYYSEEAPSRHED